MPPFAAYLRVYEPLSAFDPDQQRYWRRYIGQGRAVLTHDGPRRQREAVVAALGAGWTRLPELPDEAYVLDDGDEPLVCPWSLRLRVAEAALDARDGVPAVIADAFIPPPLAASARQVVAHAGGRRTHEQVAPWRVPLRWFVFVDAGERQVSTVRPGRMLRYRTGIGQARRRAARGVAALRRSVGDTPVTEAVAEAARWLSGFHPGSVVELDYGGLVELLSDEDLVNDESPRLAAEGLRALARGDVAAASVAYERLLATWRSVRLFEQVN